MDRHERRGVMLEDLEPRLLLAASPAGTAITGATAAALAASAQGAGSTVATTGVTAGLSQSAALTLRTVPGLAGSSSAAGATALATTPLTAPSPPTVTVLPADLRSQVALAQASLTITALAAGPSIGASATVGLTEFSQTAAATAGLAGASTVGAVSSLAAVTSSALAPFSDPGSLNADIRSLIATLQGA